MKRAFLAAVMAACSSPAKPKVVEQPVPGDCVMAERTEVAYTARRGVLLGVLAKGRAFQVGATLDADAGRATCAGVPAELRMLCFEGIAQSYGAALAKTASEAAVRAAPAELA
jgi:hypothetical protein